MAVERGRSWELYSWQRCWMLAIVRALVSVSSGEEGSEIARLWRRVVRILGRVRESWGGGGDNSDDWDADSWE
jgi:hypothetical protein